MQKHIDIFDNNQYYLICWFEGEDHQDTSEIGPLTAEQARIFWAALKEKNIQGMLNSGSKEFILELIQMRNT